MKMPRIKWGEWPSITSKLFMAFGGAMGLKSFVDAYDYYIAGQETWALGSVAMGALIIFMYFFNYRLINSVAESQARVCVAEYRLNQHMNVVKMEAEIIMHRNGMDVPEGMRAHVSSLDGVLEYD